MRDQGLIVLASCMAVLGLPSSHGQAPLSIDTGFRLAIESQNAYDLEFLPGGNLLVSGYFDFPDEFPNGIYRRTLLKLNAQGEMDLSFPCCNGLGKMVPWNGKYYVQSGQSLRRIMVNGQLDPAFNFIGQWQQISALQGGDYHVYPDGRVLLGGYYDIIDPAHGYYQWVGYNLAWITNEGRLDTTRIHRTGNGTVRRIMEYPAGTAGGLGGRFLIHHWGTTYEGQPVSKVFRIHADGALDESFNAPIPWGYIYDMLPLPDGRAYLGGMFRLENQSDTIQLIRVMPDGSLDPTFNNALDMVKGEGFTFWDASVSDLLLLDSGLIIVTGFFAEVEGQPYSGICMLDTLGNVVLYYFQGGGCGSYDYQIGQMTQRYGGIEGITRAPNGQYYIYGAYHGYSDGTTTDTLQRMVTRLHGGEIGLGVPEQRPQPELMLSLKPNPADAWVAIDYDLKAAGAGRLEVHDALGRRVHERVLGNGKGQVLLDTRPWGEGLYTVRLTDGAGRMRSERLIAR